MINLNKFFILIILLLFVVNSPLESISIVSANNSNNISQVSTSNNANINESNSQDEKKFNSKSIMWVILAILFIALEINTLTLTSLWFAFGSIVAMISTNFIISTFGQFLVFLLSSLIFIVALTPITRKYIHKEKIPTNIDRIINMIGVVSEEVSWNSGEVKVDGKIWTSRLKDDTNHDLKLKEGTKVEILEIKGVKLLVKPLESQVQSNSTNKDLVIK